MKTTVIYRIAPTKMGILIKKVVSMGKLKKKLTYLWTDDGNVI